MLVSPDVFSKVLEDRTAGSKLWRAECRRDSRNRVRKFRAHFGVDSIHCSLLWEALADNSVDGLYGWKPYHLLDALFFLKVYPSEDCGCTFARCDAKTLRKWNWKVIEAISDLEFVRTTIINLT